MSATIQTLNAPLSRVDVAGHERRTFIRLRRGHLTVVVPGAVLLVFALAAIFADQIAPYDPNALDLHQMLAAPRADHLFGTDQLGRDQLSRTIYGGRNTLAMAALATAGTVLTGLLVGVTAGYFGGKFDLLVSSILTVVLALPSLLLVLAILGILGPSSTSLLIALIASGWAGYARIFRAAILSLREQVYIESAVSLGATPARVVGRHLIPNLLTTVVVLATLDVGTMILTITSLSFLGLGVQPPTADWGTMLSDARASFGQYPFLALAPGICITLVAFTSNLLGDGIRDLVDVGR